MNTFGSGNWMEMCQVIAPAACFVLLESERGRESEMLGEGVAAESLRSAGPSESIFRPSPWPSGVFSRPLLSGPANAFCAR